MVASQKSQLKQLISVLVSASEELGAVPSSLYWNAAYSKQLEAQNKVNAFINSIEEQRETY